MTDHNLRGLTTGAGQSISVNRVVIHMVPANPKGADNPAPLDLSQSSVVLTREMRGFMHDMIRKTFAKDATPIEENTATNAKMPGRVRDLIDAPNQLVAVSQDAAAYLDEAQGASSSHGLLVMARGTVTTGNLQQPAVLVMKLKIQEGANVEKTGGTYTPEYLEGLMLSSDTEVFKTAVLTKASDGTDDLLGVVSDEQTAGGAATWRETFLGMKRSRSPETVTRGFYETGLRYIRNSIDDEYKKLDYEQRLKMTVTDQANRIDVQQFLTTQIAPEDRDDFERALREAGVPTGRFEKDISWMRPAQRQMTLKFSSGIVIKGDADDVAERVKREERDGDPVTVIYDVYEGVK